MMTEVLEKIAFEDPGPAVFFGCPRWPLICPAAPQPHHDAFTRWWLENVGGLPTPEDVRKFKRRLEASNLLLDEDRHADLIHADLLAAGDPEGGIPPFDPEEEAAAYARVGIDVRDDPHFAKLFELAELGRLRASKRSKSRDPKAILRARSVKAEKALRKTRKAAAKRSRTCSKVIRRSPLRDPERDRKILAEIQGFLAVGVGVRFTPLKRELVSPHSSSPLLPATTTGRSTAYDPVIQLPPWSKASLPLTGMAMGIAAGNQGAVDFTLHLGDSGIAYARGVGELLFARRLHRRITDALKLKCPRMGYSTPDLFFLVEQGEGERPHLHGVIFAPADKALRRHLRDTLSAAVGTDWKPPGRDKTQLEFGSFYEPAGWVKYMTKWTELTKEKVGDNVFACSWSMTRNGKDWYETVRGGRGLLLPGKAVLYAT